MVRASAPTMAKALNHLLSLIPHTDFGDRDAVPVPHGVLVAFDHSA
jgi:hypothetical protein